MVVTCKHRFVYYYHILLRHESLRDVFTFLVTRFEHRPPRFIIYDNACELSRYCEGVSRSCALCFTFFCSLLYSLHPLSICTRSDCFLCTHLTMI
jgi:hypothetical protein